jgi:hypothetical protein
VCENLKAHLRLQLVLMFIFTICGVHTFMNIIVIVGIYTFMIDGCGNVMLTVGVSINVYC